METPQTTRQALELTIEGWAALERECAGLGEPDLLRPGMVGEWSLRDLLAHLGASNRWTAGQLDAPRRGELPDPVACVAADQPPPPDIDLATDDGRTGVRPSRCCGRRRWPRRGRAGRAW